MESRRNFLKQAASTMLVMAVPDGLPNLNQTLNQPKISLAQWSLNRAMKSGALQAEDFATISKGTYGIEAVEYVSGLYPGKKQNGG
ncbi:MAG: sugar phosphate isomerase/epimerase, partial [Bacteroidota bacterium]